MYRSIIELFVLALKIPLFMMKFVHPARIT